MLVDSIKANKIYSRLEKANEKKALQSVLHAAISFERSDFLSVMDIIQKLKIGKDFYADDSIIYLIEKELEKWEKTETLPAHEIKVTVKGFNDLAEAKEFCNWYSGSGEQDSSYWFECRKEEGVINSRSMLSTVIAEVDKNNVEMILEMHD